MGVENKDNCLQRDSAEREGYVRAHRSFRRILRKRLKSYSGEYDFIRTVIGFGYKFNE